MGIEFGGILGLIILIRTFLGFTLHFEIEGKWPWEAAQRGDKERGTEQVPDGAK